ncbi:hypothetical protein [Gymnodinialimonas ceratoperidinii]|uniref:Uncharacterized protein n=1 Tax=Gymnodinialimonas ceratoperidinii TaxID=2856823 RepID=A0A8F6TUY2_9RHOB|nr:hypothetical protein [Gymnodinialimonas ceratoperidinii]QXT39185.1 hypothetical protein KYE46_14830 [Gymnodinialimonas ceratoperidinii]
MAPLVAMMPAFALAQVATPGDHPGFVLAEAIAAQGCVLHQDDVNDLLASAGLENAQFPQMAVPLMRDGYLAPSGEGTLTLVNWGLCMGQQIGETDEAEGAAQVEESSEGGAAPEAEITPDVSE